jgi:hypothetical protein
VVLSEPPGHSIDTVVSVDVRVLHTDCVDGEELCTGGSLSGNVSWSDHMRCLVSLIFVGSSLLATF